MQVYRQLSKSLQGETFIMLAVESVTGSYPTPNERVNVWVILSTLLG